MTDSSPQRFGDYEIIRELGQGGMGKVYLVRNVLSDRVEAMKVLLPDLAGRNEFVARFMREIKTLAALDHPNIAALRTAFTAGDQFVMIMEYIDGVTLADRLQQGPFSTADAVNYTGQVLSALSYAHAKHVIHRDIKPGNMMLTPKGVVKLMDFGLARSIDEVGLTRTGTTLGSLDYASPEQVQSQAADERSDLYSVGVSLYQMITGQRMFTVTSSFSIMQAQVNEIPRAPMDLVPTLPKTLNDAILKAVAKDPGQRFQSADEFQVALSRTAAGDASSFLSQTAFLPAPPTFDPGFTVTPEQQRQGSRNLLTIAAVVVIAALVAGGAIYQSLQHRETRHAAVAAVEAAPSQSNLPPASSPEQSQPAAPQAPLATPDEAKPATQPPRAAGARKAKITGESPSSATGPSAEESQAQQQAALEQKRQLDAMETEADQLDSRAESVESSLDALEQQMHRDGMGLRGDMVAARANMRTDLTKAKQAMDSNDTERARHYLDLAHHEVEKLEAFLGRR